MVGLTDVNGKVLKHYAQDTINYKRYIIIALQNETDPDTCSVVDIDDLESNIRSELVALVNSQEGQFVEELWSLLDRKYFLDYPQATMLKILKAMRKILVVDSKQVAVQVPGDKIMTPKDVAEGIKLYKAKKNSFDNVQHGFNPDSDAKPLIEKVGEKEPNKEVEELKSEMKTLNDKVDSLVDVLSKLASNMASKEETEKKKK